MFNRYISIDVSRKNEEISKYAIVFHDEEIERFIFLHEDYTVIEFLDYITKEYYRDTNYFIFDKNSMGIVIEDYFKEKGITDYLLINNIKTPETFVKSKERLVDFAMNSKFDNISNMEFKKLIEEINNIEISIRGNGNVQFKKIDPDMNIKRAICYLNYLSSKC